MKKVFIILGSLVLIAVIAVTAFFAVPRSEKYEEHKRFRQTFGILTYETLNSSMSDKEKEKAELIYKEVEKALNYTGSKADCKIDEALFPLCVFTDDYDYTTILSDAVAITYTELFGTGYFWFEYTRACINKSGETVTGSMDVLCLVKVKNSDNGFTIEDVVIEP